jgi:hypothetical protein
MESSPGRKRWTFGVAPLPESIALAEKMRSVAGLVLSLDATHPAIERLLAALDEAEVALGAVAPSDPTPRLGPDAPPERRVYIDHARDVGDFNPCFPTYAIQVDGDHHASGTVRFPLVYEGPPGLVHGGYLALLFDAVVQHHNCDVGLAGKTTSLTIRYRRPTPLLVELAFEIERSVADGRILSAARLTREGVVLCEAEVSAVAGVRTALPEASPRRRGA